MSTLIVSLSFRRIIFSTFFKRMSNKPRIASVFGVKNQSQLAHSRYSHVPGNVREKFCITNYFVRMTSSVFWYHNVLSGQRLKSKSHSSMKDSCMHEKFRLSCMGWSYLTNLRETSSTNIL